MKRVGQCPSCNARYELEETDVGHLLECECGSALFACDAFALREIPVRCDSCGDVYEVDAEDAGHPVECECGSTMTVPTVVFRLPIGTAQDAAAAIAELLVDADDLCAVDDGPEEVRGSSIGDAEQGSDSPLFRTGEPQDSTAGIRLSVEATPSSTRGAGRSDSRAKSRKAYGTWLGTAVVAAFLIFAIAMFLMRDPTAASPKMASNSPGSVAGAPPVERREAADDLSASDPELVAELVSMDLDPAPPRDLGEVGETSDELLDAKTEQFPIPSAPLYKLPEPTEVRMRVPLSTERLPRMTLNRGVEKAFEAYEETQKRRTESETSKLASDVEAYHRSLGEALSLIEHVHRLAVREADQQQINSMRYLLAYLYYQAGHLPEACIMGEAVARWGDQADPATKEAAMIALAATQELSESHWADPEMVGELSQMEMIVVLLAQRWPDDPQLDLIWMNLAYLYEAFNFPRKAIAVYSRLDQTSPQHADAQINSGMARWMVARRNSDENAGNLDADELKVAREELLRGLRRKEEEDAALNPLTVDVRLTLAQIDLVLGNPDQAEKWLVKPPPSVIDSIRVEAGDDTESVVLVEEATARKAFDLVFFLRQQAGDDGGATDALEKMSSVLRSSESQVGTRRVSVVKGVIDRLTASSAVSTLEVERLVELTEPLLEDESSFPTSNLLWLGESWSQVGLRATDPETASECASRAAALYGAAMVRTDFPSSSQQAAQLKRIELLRRSGAVLESLKLIQNVLAKTPNVFALQIEAAESLQRLALDSGQASDLTAAIEGPQGFSSIWGWRKLVTSLHAVRWSERGNETHVQQLHHAQFNWTQCRYLLAMQLSDPAAKRAALSELDRSVGTLLATMEEASPWHRKFEQLRQLVSKAI